MKTAQFVHEGQTVYEYTLQNNFLKVTFLNIGACMTSLIDLSTGINLILTHEHLSDYIKNPGFMNGIVGRNAGRIQDAMIKIAGKPVPLSKNFMKRHQLHGGYHSFILKYFTAVESNQQITFCVTSPDLEDGFPGDLTLQVTYRLIDHELHIDYDAVSNKKTWMNFTNHAYFNLNGKGDILDHCLCLSSNHYMKLNEEMIPYVVESVDHTPFDFRIEKPIREAFIPDEQIEIAHGIDHPFLIEEKGLVAQLFGEKLQLEVYSDQAAVVIYTGNYTKPAHSGICLELQGIPNAMHFQSYMQHNIFEANEHYTQHSYWVIKKA